MTALSLSTTPELKVKPLLRGTSHAIGFFVALIGLVPLLLSGARGNLLLAGLVHGLSLVAMLGTSGFYHQLNWSEQMRGLLRRLDHATIYALIAGSLTPFAVLVGEGQLRWWLGLYWLAAALCAAFAAFVDHGLRWLRAGLNVVVGLSAIPIVWHLPALIGVNRVMLLVASSAVYIVGAVVYARRWPNPSPRVFGYHEVFHVMVLVAAGIQYGITLSVLRGAR
jgi:hemolysin III